LTYLNSHQVKALSTDPPPNILGTRFLKYCSVYWGVHAKRGLTNSTRSLAVELLKESYGPISTKLLLEKANFPYWRYDTFSPFTGLHCASFFGIVEVVATLIEIKCYDINEGDFGGYTPLAWASPNGHEGVVKLLLEREEVNPDRPSRRGQLPPKDSQGSRTPLSYAAEGGYEGVVKLLLEREEVNPDKPDNDG